MNQPRFSWSGLDFWRISSVMIPTGALEFSAATGASRCVLAFFTDCGFLSTEPKLDMVQCAAAHEARDGTRVPRCFSSFSRQDQEW